VCSGLVGELIVANSVPSAVNKYSGNRPVLATQRGGKLRVLTVIDEYTREGHAESFNNRFRMECLNRELTCTLSKGRVAINDWRHYYESALPHRPGRAYFVI